MKELSGIHTSLVEIGDVIHVEDNSTMYHRVIFPHRSVTVVTSGPHSALGRTRGRMLVLLRPRTLIPTRRTSIHRS